MLQPNIYYHFFSQPGNSKVLESFYTYNLYLSTTPQTSQSETSWNSFVAIAEFLTNLKVVQHASFMNNILETQDN